MRKMKTKVLAFALTFALAIGTIVAPATSVKALDVAPPSEGTEDFDYRDMEAELYDSAVLNEHIDSMKKLINDAKINPSNLDEKAFSTDYAGIIAELTKLDTDYALIDIAYYGNVNDEEASDMMSEIDEIYEDCYDSSYQVLRDALDSPYEATLVQLLDNEELVEDLKEYKDMTPREKEISKRLTDLEDDYNEVLHDDVVDEDVNKKAAEIYIEMVSLRNEIAQINGYSDYAEYAYKEVYNRDYTTDEIKYVYDQVKEYVVPAFDEIQSDIYSKYDYSINDIKYDDGEVAWDNIQRYIGEIDPSLLETMEFMREHHLYDVDPDEDKMSMGFTTGLPEYGAAFIFSSPNGYYNDYTTLVHEFGHFYAKMHSEYNPLVSDATMDVSEINSQGLELLDLEYADKMYGEKAAGVFKEIILYNMLYSMIQGCLYDEFQVAVYKDGNMTVDELNETFTDLAKQYGVMEEEEQGYYLDWVIVNHTFQSPMYYISYATSALSAVDIFGESLTNRQDAIDKYISLCKVRPEQTYKEVVAENGLRDIFAPNTIKDIMSEVTTYASGIGTKSSVSSAIDTLGELVDGDETEDSVGVMTTILAFIITMIIMLSIVLIPVIGMGIIILVVVFIFRKYAKAGAANIMGPETAKRRADAEARKNASETNDIKEGANKDQSTGVYSDKKSNGTGYDYY